MLFRDSSLHLSIVFKKKIFQTPGLSSLGSFSRQAAERENGFRYIGKREQHLLDLLGERLTRREGVQGGLLLFALLLELLNRAVVG